MNLTSEVKINHRFDNGTKVRSLTQIVAAGKLSLRRSGAYH